MKRVLIGVALLMLAACGDGDDDTDYGPTTGNGEKWPSVEGLYCVKGHDEVGLSSSYPRETTFVCDEYQRLPSPMPKPELTPSAR